MQIKAHAAEAVHRCGGETMVTSIREKDRALSGLCELHEAAVAQMVAQHAMVRSLCTALEECADHLPDREAIVAAIPVSSTLAESMRRHNIAETLILSMPLDSGLAALVSGLLVRIRHFNAVDHLHAEDLCDALVAASRMPGPVRADALSYMMRCLFDGCRRSIDFQEAAILMLARDWLTLAARASLGTSLADAGSRSAAIQN